MQTQGFSWVFLEGFSTTSIKKKTVKGQRRKGKTMTKFELLTENKKAFDQGEDNLRKLSFPEAAPTIKGGLQNPEYQNKGVLGEWTRMGEIPWGKPLKASRTQSLQ